MTSDPDHPRLRLADTLNQPVRFSIAAALSATESMEFRTLRDRIQVTDSLLSKQLSILEQADIVEIKKGYVGKRPRTWLSFTGAGAVVWREHLAALREIAGGL